MRTRPSQRRRTCLHLALAAALLGAGLAPARAQGVELAALELQRDDGVLSVSFDVRLALPKAVEAALQHGVPVYFVAQATLWRSRWYWRDERVARVTRSWRVIHLPLTGAWRVSLGGFNQPYPSLNEALAAIARSTRWKLADLTQLDAESRYYVEFSYRLDSSQLPSPMQLGLGGRNDWQLGVEHTLRLEPP